MAFRRVTMKMAGVARADIDPSMAKWWGKHSHVDGQVTQHLSPYEQQIVAPLLKGVTENAPKQLWKWARDIGGPLILALGTYLWSLEDQKQRRYHHRF